jgi:hypothetical protein
MPKTHQLYNNKLNRALRKRLVAVWQWPGKYWRKNWWHKVIFIFVCFVLLCLGTMYGIARWYIWSNHDQPLSLGVSFIPDYAESLGLNPNQTMSALINDLHVKNFRLVSYWSDIEPAPGQYNFSQLDSEFAMADAAHAKITLTVGLRQPGYPECHPPSWVDTSQPTNVWQPELEQFMTTVINRYKNNPALANYQLENEYFLKGFGTCQNFSRARLVSEDNLVKKLDPTHPIIIGRSNNALGFPVGQPTPNEFSISIYQRVWDANVTHRYIEYPFPAWFYAFLAGVQKIFTGHNMIIGELQAEPWAPNGKTIPQTSLAEQNKSFNPTRLKNTIQFGEATGVKTIYLWGTEYWYYRLTVEHQPDVWNNAKQAFAQANSQKN